jgi:hypothetical protein
MGLCGADENSATRLASTWKVQLREWLDCAAEHCVVRRLSLAEEVSTSTVYLLLKKGAHCYSQEFGNRKQCHWFKVSDITDVRSAEI